MMKTSSFSFKASRADLASNELEEIPGFFQGPGNKQCIPLLACCTRDGNILVGVGSSDSGFYFCLREQGEKPKQFDCDLKMQAISTISTIEIDLDSRYVIVGGSTRANSSGDAIICAYSLDKKVRQAAMQLFQNYRCVSRIVRVPNMNKFIAATTNFIFVVEFVNEIKFNTIGTIRNINNNSRL